MWIDEYGLRRPYLMFAACFGLGVLGFLVIQLGTSLEWPILALAGFFVAIPSILAGMATFLFIFLEQTLRGLGLRGVAERFRNLKASIRARKSTHDGDGERS